MINIDLHEGDALEICSKQLEAYTKWGRTNFDILSPVIVRLIEIANNDSVKQITALQEALAKKAKLITELEERLSRCEHD